MNRKSLIQEMEFTGAGAVTQGDSRLNQPIAKEHGPHVTMDNPQKEYISGAAKMGKLGAKGQAGNN